MTDREIAPWEKEIFAAAEVFSVEVHLMVKSSLEKTLKHLPEDNQKNRQIQLSIFLEAIIGQAVAEVANYINPSWETERKFVKSVEAKFHSAREFEKSQGGN